MLSIKKLIETTNAAYAYQQQLKQEMLAVLETPPDDYQQALPSGPKFPVLAPRAATLHRARVRDMRGSQPPRVLVCAVCHWQIKANDWMIAMKDGREFDIHERCQGEI